jgi:hypothetical protein
MAVERLLATPNRDLAGVEMAKEMALDWKRMILSSSAE